MRFYWGLGVGHVYSHECRNPDIFDDEEGAEESDTEQLTVPCDNGATVTLHPRDDYEDDEDIDPEPEVVAELGLGDREKDILTDSDDEEENDDCGVQEDDSSGGEEELELEDTYNGKY